MDNPRQKAVVVYESIYGNTRSIAQAIAEGLQASVDAELVPAAEMQGRGLEGVSLVVAGGPTHGHGMSRPQMRQEGIREAAASGNSPDPGSEGPWLREWFASDPEISGWAAAFDTRYDMPELLTGHASKGILKRLERHGLRRLVEPESFLVTRENRLLPGEAQRALEWGALLGESLVQAESLQQHQPPL
ncbi:flavodoxin domain-containing protein [Sinomonas sp. RB5]